jgi:hypothetical protein
MRSALAFTLLLFFLLGTSGCSTLFKDDYWDQIHEQSDKDEEARIHDDPQAAFFLGVRAQAAELPFQVGVPVLHVYAEGPAAKAGLREGDEIRVIDQYPVRTPGDTRWVLSNLWKEHAETSPRWKTRIVFARDGREVESEIELTSREQYLDTRRRRVIEFSRYEQHGYNAWGFVKKRTIPADLIQDYFGVKVAEDLVVAEDVDVLPLVFGISIFRWETIPVADATRITVICSLLQFSSRGDDVARTLAGLIPDPPAGSTDL